MLRDGIRSGFYSVVYMDDWERREDGHRNVYGIYSVFTVRKNIMKRAGRISDHS